MLPKEQRLLSLSPGYRVEAAGTSTLEDQGDMGKGAGTPPMAPQYQCLPAPLTGASSVGSHHCQA